MNIEISHGYYIFAPVLTEPVYDENEVIYDDDLEESAEVIYDEEIFDVYPQDEKKGGGTAQPPTPEDVPAAIRRQHRLTHFPHQPWCNVCVCAESVVTVL